MVLRCLCDNKNSECLNELRARMRVEEYLHKKILTCENNIGQSFEKTKNHVLFRKTLLKSVWK